MSADSTPVDRRNLLRGGALLAGVAGVTALSAVQAPSASAADGDEVVLGQANEASSTTAIRIGTEETGSVASALTLQNSGGPSLGLTPAPATWQGELQLGEIANTEYGPLIGVLDYFDEVTTSILATEFDLNTVPRPVPVPPERVLDTRTPAGRFNIVGASSGNAFDSAGRLRGGSWMNVAIAVDIGELYDAAFLNVTTTGSLANGFLSVYPPGNRPPVSTLNYVKGQSIANATFVGLTNVNGEFLVQVYSSATANVLIDVTGLNLSIPFAQEAPAAAARKKKNRKASPARRVRPALSAPKRLGRRR